MSPTKISAHYEEIDISTFSQEENTERVGKMIKRQTCECDSKNDINREFKFYSSNGVKLNKE